MAWVTDGTVTVTQGSAIITGAATNWDANVVLAGDAFLGPDGAAYEIASLNSGSELTLAANYAGANASAASYRIHPTQARAVQSLSAMGALMAKIDAKVDPLDDIAAGLFSDGTEAEPGMAFKDDPDNGLRRISANLWALVAAGSDVVTLDGATGNVGFNTSAPGETVDVNGAVGILSGATVIGKLFNSAGVLALQGDGTRDVKIGSGSYPDALFVEGSSGDVGFGTDDPQATVDIRGSYSDTAGEGVLSLGESSNPYFSWRLTTSTADMILDRSYGGWQSTPVMAFDRSTGNVGYGTGAPGQEIHVQSATGTEADIRLAGDNGDSDYLDMYHNTGTFGLWGTGTQDMALGVGDGEKMRITNAGDVLPGTTETQDLGSASKEWDNAFLQNAVIVSDAKRKKDIFIIKDASKFLRLTEPVWFTYRDKIIPEETKDVERQVTVTKQRDETVIEIIDGRPVQVTKTVDYDEPQFTEIAVVNEAGTPVLREVQTGLTGEVLDKAGKVVLPAKPIMEMQPLMHRVPVMETVAEITPAQTIAHSRPHTGFVAQKIKEAMTAAGYEDWSGYAYDEDSDTHMLRLMEMIAFTVKGWQELDARLTALEAG